MIRLPGRGGGRKGGRNPRGNMEQVEEMLPPKSAIDLNYCEQFIRAKFSKDYQFEESDTKAIRGYLSVVAKKNETEEDFMEILRRLLPGKGVEDVEEDEHEERISARNITCKELERLAIQQGFIYKTSTGGHRQYEHQDGRKTTIPFSGSKDAVAYGTAQSILEKIGF